MTALKASCRNALMTSETSRAVRRRRAKLPNQLSTATPSKNTINRAMVLVMLPFDAPAITSLRKLSRLRETMTGSRNPIVVMPRMTATSAIMRRRWGA